MPSPLASIVIATYRSRHDHLSAALASALAQTVGNIEVIVSDDSPTDGLRPLVTGFRDARLRYRHNLPALGVACNHWQSFREALGAYVAVLNHDDWLAPNFVETLAGELQRHPEAALAFCDHWIIDQGGRRLDAQTRHNSQVWGRASLRAGLHRPCWRLLADQTIPMAMGALFRHSALPPELPEHAGPAYDLWLAYLLCREGGSACYVPARLSAWRTHPGNLTTASGLDWLRGAAACWDAMAHDPALSSERRQLRRQAALSHRSCAWRAWSSGRRSECLQHALRSLAYRVTAKGILACGLPLLPRRLGRTCAGSA